MSASTLTFATWGCAVPALLCALGMWLRVRGRLERVARATHELRAPLTAARLAAHAAQRTGGPEALAAVDGELARAALVLDDLEVARRGRPPALRTAAVDAATLLADVSERWRPLVWPVGRELRVEDETGGRPLRVHGDRVRLGQALGNLVANALEHGAGPVVLRARAQAGEVRFEVDDAGLGLSRSLSRLTRRRRGGRGSRGRGLAIAAEVARGHGGVLRDERLPGGCRVALVLPGGPSAEAPTPGEGPASRARRRTPPLRLAAPWRSSR
jgi:signal transduction histidine kinase